MKRVGIRDVAVLAGVSISSVSNALNRPEAVSDHVRTRVHEGPFYTILNDGMQNGLKRKADDRGPTEAALFNGIGEASHYHVQAGSLLPA